MMLVVDRPFGRNPAAAAHPPSVCSRRRRADGSHVCETCMQHDQKMVSKIENRVGPSTNDRPIERVHFFSVMQTARYGCEKDEKDEKGLLNLKQSAIGQKCCYFNQLENPNRLDLNRRGATM